MIDSILGLFKSRSDYDEVAQKRMAKIFFEHGFKVEYPSLLRIKDEYEKTFGKTLLQKHNNEVISITKMECNHVRYWEYVEATS